MTRYVLWIVGRRPLKRSVLIIKLWRVVVGSFVLSRVKYNADDWLSVRCQLQYATLCNIYTLSQARLPAAASRLSAPHPVVPSFLFFLWILVTTVQCSTSSPSRRLDRIEPSTEMDSRLLWYLPWSRVLAHVLTRRTRHTIVSLAYCRYNWRSHSIENG